MYVCDKKFTLVNYQEKLFKVVGFPMVENCVGGYNSCMFAYGQVSICSLNFSLV